MADSFRLLVIDDDPGVREYLQALMSRRGYVVFTAGGGEEALSGLPVTRPDLITLDLVLGGMDGLETLRRLKKRAPDVPVVMLSGHGQARQIVEAMQLALSPAERSAMRVKPPEVVGAYDYYLKGLEFMRHFTERPTSVE